MRLLYIKGKKYLGVFQLKLSQLHQVLPEGGHSSRLEVHQLCGQNRAAQRTGTKETDKNYFPYLAWPSRRFSQTFGSRAADWSRLAGHLGSWPGPCPELCWRSRSPLASDCGGKAGPGGFEDGHMTTESRDGHF